MRWPRKGLSAAAFFIFLPAPPRARIISASFFRGNGLFLLRASRRAAYEIELGHFLILLLLDIAREILDRELRLAALVARAGLRLLLFFKLLFGFFGRVRQHRPRTAAASPLAVASIACVADLGPAVYLHEAEI